MKTPGPLLETCERFHGLRVAVLGEAMLDSYLYGAATALCKEAPAPIVKLTDRSNAPGGAANTAANVRALGARVELLSVVGADDDGRLLKRSLDERGVGTEHLIEHSGRRTLSKSRLVCDGQILIRFDQGTPQQVDETTEQALVDRLDGLLPGCDALIVSDYAAGLIGPRVLEAVAALSRRLGLVVAVDARDLVRHSNCRPTVVKPNYQEAVRLLKLASLDQGDDRAGQVISAGPEILELSAAQIAAVTLDIDGGVLLERDAPPYRTYTRPVVSSRALGAGDTYTAALTLALAAGAHGHEAAELAAHAAAVVVEKEGTARCSIGELRTRLLAQDKYAADLDALMERVKHYRRQGRRIVFTNGCFDLIHRGHIAYLVQAKALGDVLVVGVNSDAGVRRLKGPDRPINGLEDRVEVLGALSCIDHLIGFDEPTPARLIDAIRPDVFVKGGDYEGVAIPEAAQVRELGGEVRILPYIDGRSTSRMIERIGAAYAASPGGVPAAD